MARPKSTPEKKKTEKKEPYCRNADLLREVLIFKDTDVVTEQLGKYLIAIAWHLTGHSCFRQYSYSLKEDFVGAALTKMVKGLANFNPEKSKNPFAYFTQICWNSFVYSCKDYYRQINIKKQVFEKYLTSIESAQAFDPTSLTDVYIKNLLDANQEKKDKEMIEE